MERRCQMFVASIVLALFMLTGGWPAFAQQRDTISIGKLGHIHLKAKVEVGDVVLDPGRYEVQHVARGDRHQMVFRELVVPVRGGIIWPREVARVNCDFVPIEGKVKKTNFLVSASGEGLQTMEELSVKGETVKHVFTRPA